LWPEDDIQVWKGGGHASPYWSVVSDGLVGLSSSGVVVRNVRKELRGWHSPQAISEDGCGGVFISWVASKFIGDETASYVQRIDTQGNRL
jgi:hypothetical protein